jgi:N-acetylmuramoyl-L-alanine amidase
MSRLATSLIVLLATGASAQKVLLNPSDQVNNSVAGGGVESTYALDIGNRAKPILTAAGFDARVDQDFYNSPGNANSWGAAVFVSLHTNAGGGHGIETLTTGSTQGSALASHQLSGLLSKVPYQTRGVKVRNNLHVLNATNMPATLQEAVFHDCAVASGYAGHPPSESAFLRSVSGRDLIAAGTAAGVCGYFGKSCSASPPPPPPPPPPPAKGFLKGVVYVNPDLNSHLAPATVTLNTGASVTYDGSAVWSIEVPAGTYTITAAAAGYKGASVTRTVAAGQTVYGSIGLDPVATVATTGFLKGVVFANPNLSDVITGASVRVGTGASKVTTSTDEWSFELPPGTYTVTAEAPGYVSASITRTVTAGATVAASVGLDLVAAAEPDAGVVEVPATEIDPQPTAEPAPLPVEKSAGQLQAPAATPAVGAFGCSSGAGLALPFAALLVVGWALGRRRRA